MSNKRTGPDYLDQKSKAKKTKMKVHHRSSSGPDTRKPWERGGISEAEYKKLPQKYKDMLN
jgi:hypothetical protein